MTYSESELWGKIKTFQFDPANIRATFAKRLARENDISEQFANQIVDEYRKFIFLCCVSTGQIAPSHFVDQAWHLHLTYTKSYWIDLCKNTINRDLHHNPTQGGKEEDAKFKKLYKDTLNLYESYFSSKAPAAIWPDDNHGPGNTKVEVDKSKNWIIPKPDLSLLKQKGSFSIVAIILVALLVGCSAGIGIISVIVAVLIILVAIVVSVFRKNKRQNDGDSISGCGSGCGGGGDTDTHSHSHGGDSGDSGDSGGGDSGCSSGCSGGCGGGD